MTGFGRAEHAGDQLIARVEISSVNRKQGEVVVQMPRSYSELEARIRKAVLSCVSRGRIHVAISIEKSASAGAQVDVNLELAKALELAFTRLSATLERSVTPAASDFLRTPEVFSFDQEEADADAAWTVIQPALQNALKNLVDMRSSEGDDLETDINARLDSLAQLADQIETHAPSVLENYRQNLQRRLSEAELEVDLADERIVKEIALFADRCDISEETTRLRSHLRRFHEYLQNDEPSGRPLDFLCQELNREFNTIGSKANDAILAQLIVTSKTELEKIREQIQNVE